MTDSENLVTFLSKGSTKMHIQEVVLDVLKMARQMNIHLVPIHLRREDPRIKMADEGSKKKDSDDWSIDLSSFEMIRQQFGPFTIDLFADQSNKKVDRFYSDFLCPKSLGIDAFAHSWDHETAWICPPVGLVPQVIRKIRQTKGDGVLIIPRWVSASFWALLFPDGKQPPRPFKDIIEFHPFVTQNQLARSVLSGKTEFPFLAIYYDSK